ncbi:MATE family efflux transporter [Halorubrum sp. Atlit-8R]|uniref:MATE family efflux transporter n=1 Tax=unclassified Halorubrum TaxID=2642239 RepID=UPI000EF282D4|nr:MULTISPECIES: MATE family efflux transporter [unclassified Halorubrum]RLM67524.1 MATE family efflux transporter [Halorubrum sp. Atlit-9R]RLM77683.1 MATE family efflux transporter [Halorubrum sp. Atlit-8R]
MDLPRLRRVWKRVFSLAWPVMAEQTFRTAMRTTDILVTALFSPAAVVAIGLADLYARFPLRIGLGLGGGAIALSSQDTGAGAAENRDEAVTQAILLGALAGVPFVLFGFLFGEFAIGVFGRLVGERTSPAVVDLGSTYLAIVFATAPARHVALVGARALQGTGDTRTPMYVNIAANSVNIAGSIVLGLGLFGLPRLDVLGVGLATAGANVLTAGLLCFAIWGSWTDAEFAWPCDLTIAKQLLVVSAPRVLEGFGSEIAEFPFNALLLGFGETVNAGFQIGRRVYQQVTGPLSRGYNVAASVLVGQALGEGDPEAARFNGWAVAGLGVLTVGSIGLGLVVSAPRIVPIFTDDAATVASAVDFARVYGVAGAALACFSALSGSLQGASETQIPLVARVSAMFGLFLGLSWLLGRTVGLGPTGAYVGVSAAYVWMALVVAAGFRYTGWAGRAADMMDARGSGPGADPDAAAGDGSRADDSP